MGKLLRLKDWILLTAATGSDIFEEIRLAGDLIPSLMEARYGFVPPVYKKKSYIQSVSRLLKVGDIEKRVDNKGEMSLVLLPSGKESLSRRFPILTKSKWDGNMMAVIFDIPETSKAARNILRDKLKQFGFGKLQESVWISPYHFEVDLSKFLESSGYADFVFVMNTTKIFGRNIKDKAREIWHLDSLNSRYKEILIIASEMLTGTRNKHGIKDVWNEYIKVLSNDPLLPMELLPNDWKQTELLETLNKVLKS